MCRGWQLLRCLLLRRPAIIRPISETSFPCLFWASRFWSGLGEVASCARVEDWVPFRERDEAERGAIVVEGEKKVAVTTAYRQPSLTNRGEVEVGDCGVH